MNIGVPFVFHVAVPPRFVCLAFHCVVVENRYPHRPTIPPASFSVIMQSKTFLLTLTLTLFTAAVSHADDKTVFEKHIRPILKAHCFHCHGEDGTKESGLDLRLQRFLIRGGESGAAIEPGKPSESYLLERIRSGEMPPGDKKLSEDDVDLIERWIATGAKTARPEPATIGDGPILTQEEREFWSFQPIRRPALPKVKNGNSVAMPIDTFVLARLEQEELSFSMPADRGTLIRRATFDLIGLPPTPEEVDSFLGDTSPDAYDRLIDRLLASPRYGERWGRHWLDVAGYADSEGYTDEDKVRSSAFRYRDYVIRAFNSGKPFDQFIREQLAGDEMVPLPHQNLSPEQIDKLAATGFLRMAPDGTGSGGIDQNIARNEVMADTIKTVSTSLLGLTVGCARCHDHRYDPISHVDYYSLRAIFEPALDWKKWKAPQTRLISLYTDADRKVKQGIEADAAKVDQERLKKTQEYIDRTLEEELATLPEMMRERLRVAYKTTAAKRTAQQKQVLKDHPSVANISAGSLYLYDRRRDERARKIDAERIAKEKRFIAETKNKELDKVPADMRDSVRIAVDTAVEKRNEQQKDLVAQFPGVAVTAGTLAKFNPAAAAELERDKAAAAKLRAEKAADNLKRFTEQAAEIRATIPPEGFVRALAEPANHIPVTFVFHRGDHEQPKQKVSPGELAVLTSTEFAIPPNNPQISTTGRRLAYARHLTNGQHPLVARVLVNRIWAHHFGRGLVNPLGDFGFLGERPTHPQLLDWLADELMRSGWQVKRLHKLIMMSATYRQTSRRTEQLEELDPDNRLYGRMSIRRLEAEVIRDSVLAVSGSLFDKMYGEPVPVMEDEVGQIVIGKETLDGERKPTKKIPLHGNEFRRSIYIQARRSRPLAVLETFDTPAMTPNCPQRNSSNVAPQALLLMNSQFSVEFSERFAQRVVGEVGDDVPAQIKLAWLLAFAKEPTVNDIAAAESFLKNQFVNFGKQTPKVDVKKTRHHALSNLCQALLGANRFIYID